MEDKEKQQELVEETLETPAEDTPDTAIPQTEATESATEQAQAAGEIGTPTGDDEGDGDEETEETGETDEAGKAITKKKKKGRYKFHMSQQEYLNVLLLLIEVQGKDKKNRIIAMVILGLALVCAVDAALNPGNYLALISASVLIMVGLSLRNTNKKVAKRAARAMRNGFTLAVEATAKGLKVQESGRDGVLMPYAMIREVYDHNGFLSLVTGPQNSLHMPKDPENPSYRAIEEKLREVVGTRYHTA